MRRYLFTRTSLTLLFILIAFHIALYLTLLNSLKKIYLSTLEQDYRNIAYRMVEHIKRDIENKDIVNLNEEIKRIDKYTGIRITLINADGTVLCDSRENPQSMENHRIRPEISDAIEKGEGKSIRLSPTLNRYMYYFALYFKESGFVLRLSSDLSDIDGFISSFKIPFGISILFSLIGIIIAFILAQLYYLREINLIEKFINKLGKGEYRERIISLKNKELQSIADNLNNLSEKLYTPLSNKSDSNILKIITLLEEPAAIFDYDGKFVISNPRFEKFIKPNVKDRYFWEIIDNFAINSALEKTIKENGKFEEEINISDRWYYLKTYRLEELKYIILFLIDITEIKEVERLRKEIITNVSHELKTPLTVLKGYIETLEEEIEDGESKRYINIIRTQTDRLINIVKNILTLSYSEMNSLEMQDVDIGEVAKNVYDLYKKRAEEKNIQLLLEITDIPLIKGDRFKLEQALINLVDNAIKFTDTGKVEIKLLRKERHILIEVIDTGTGIPEEEISKVFDKFFVGTKKKPGSGTGLGLSIAKTIVELHNGRIEVESKVNEGSKFTIYLPY